MGTYSQSRTSNGSFSICSDVKHATYIVVGGGGGGARPNAGFGRSPTNGGGTVLGTGLCASGGGAGSLNSGGYGGYGNWRSGQSGYVNYSGGPNARANSGYGSYGSGGAGQWRSPSFTGGGGGGGASCCRYCRNSWGAVPGQSMSVNIGQGGQQGGNGFRRFGDRGAAYLTQCTFDPPSVSISANPTTIIEGQNTTLSWSSSGDVSSVQISNVGNVNTSGSLSVSPISTRTYTVTASNVAYSRSDSITVTVLIKPTVSLSLDNNQIVYGQSTTLRWNTSGDANSMTISPGIGSTTLNGSRTVNPTVTTTYTASATGPGGTGSNSVVLEVLSIPEITVNAPLSVDYGDDIEFQIQAEYSDPSGNGITMTGIATDTEGQQENIPSISVPNSTGNNVNITSFVYTPTYNTKGPQSFTFTFNVDGYGNLAGTTSVSVPINIDITPDAVDIPATQDALKDETPVITPDTIVTSEQIVINDIDIPVEVKSNYPIQVDIDDADQWYSVRQIGS